MAFPNNKNSLKVKLLATFLIGSLIPIVVLIILVYIIQFQQNKIEPQIVSGLIGLSALIALIGHALTIHFISPIFSMGEEAMRILENPELQGNYILSADQYQEMMETSNAFKHAAVKLHDSSMEMVKMSAEIEKVNTQLTAKMKVLHYILEIGTQLLSDFKLHELITNILQIIREQMFVQRGVILTIDQKKSIFKIENYFNLSEDYINEMIPFIEKPLKNCVLYPYFKAKQIVNVTDKILSENPELEAFFKAFHQRYGAIIPLNDSQTSVGFLITGERMDGIDYSPMDITTLQVFSNFAAIGLHQTQKIKKTNELEIYDPLTHLYSYHFFYDRLEKEFARSERFNHHLSLFILDIDHLSRINTSFGHRIGDKVLTMFAQLLNNTIRSIDYAGRFGGDEFAIVMLETKKRDAMYLGERIRRKMESFIFDDPELADVQVTACIGLSSFPDDGKTLEELVKKAEKALSQAKASGTNNFAYSRDESIEK